MNQHADGQSILPEIDGKTLVVYLRDAPHALDSGMVIENTTL